MPFPGLLMTSCSPTEGTEQGCGIQPASPPTASPCRTCGGVQHGRAARRRPSRAPSPRRPRPPRPLYGTRLLLAAWVRTATTSRRQVYFDAAARQGHEVGEQVCGAPAVAVIALTEHRPPAPRGPPPTGGRSGCAQRR